MTKQEAIDALNQAIANIQFVAEEYPEYDLLDSKRLYDVTPTLFDTIKQIERIEE